MKKVETFVLNIGLDTPQLNFKEVINSLIMNHKLHVMKFEVSEGLYKGKKESTLIVQIRLEMSYNDVYRMLENLTIELEQDCIPVHFPHFPTLSLLQYNSNFVGEKLDFDMNYFIKGRLLPQTKL